MYTPRNKFPQEFGSYAETMRAKGTLISEPRFFYPLRDAIFPTRERENGLFKENPSTKAVFPFSRGKNRISQGVENRGSLISVPLALREMTPQKYFPVFARVRIQAPHVFAKKIIPQEMFPACIGFVPGGCTFCEVEGILLQKYRDRDGRCVTMLFKSIGVRGPEVVRFGK